MLNEARLHKCQTSNPNAENISHYGRLMRFIVAVGLILAMYPEFPLDKSSYLILIPLIAVYPLITSILGWDPIIEFWRSSHSRLSHSHKSKRYGNTSNPEDGAKLTISNNWR